MAQAILCIALALPLATTAAQPVAASSKALLQTWNEELDGGRAGSEDTPVARVVNLLKDMSKTLTGEMKEDEDLYKRLACWCENNEVDKDASIKASSQRIEELQWSIETLVARKSELQATLAELKDDLAKDQKALAEAVAMRKKQLADFNQEEKDALENLQSLKGAITVLSKHHAAPPEGAMAGGKMLPEGAAGAAPASFLAVRAHDLPWQAAASRDMSVHRDMFSTMVEGLPPPASLGGLRAEKFLQQGGASMDGEASQELSSADMALVQQVLRKAEAFVQAHHADADGYYPAYVAQSGEVLGILRQLKDDIENDLSESQKLEMQRTTAFLEVKGAKEAMIQGTQKLLDQKEEDLADASNGLANARLDLAKEKNSLTADQRFLMNLKKTCEEADENFELRKKARTDEINAVDEAIHILLHDRARDAYATTWSFLQVKVDKSAEVAKRHQASAALFQAALKFHDPRLSVLATSSELDAFTRVKKAIDDMVAILTTQQADEVKKSDWCKSEFHENEVVTARTDDEKTHLENKLSEIQSAIKALEDGIANAKTRVAQAQVQLQRASEDRKAENLYFQKTVADQAITIDVLHKALDRLRDYYNFDPVAVKGVALVQRKQTPPVPQMEYRASKGSSAVMQLMQKLITEAKVLMQDSQKSESNAQTAYEQLVGDTNSLVKALQREATAKTRAHVKAKKDELLTKSDLSDTVKELDGLAQYKIDLHAECDYILKNFDLRQQARADEIEALRQAKATLSGATMN